MLGLHLRFARLALCGLPLLVGGCTTTPVDLAYASSAIAAAPVEQRALVSVGPFTDTRKHAPNWLGAIRGGFGNPLKTLETPVPVREVVRQAFVDALRARGLLNESGEGRFVLTANVVQFDTNRFVRREAHAKFAMSLIERVNSREVVVELTQVDTIEGSLVALDTGIFGSVDELRADAEKTLRQAVDKFLDGTAFRQAIGAPQG